MREEPVRRVPVQLITEGGELLDAELALPHARAPVSTVVCVHPEPARGGSMDSHLLISAAARLPDRAHAAVLRFTCRPTAREALADLEAALRFVGEQGLPQVWVLGWSWGADVALSHGPRAGMAGLILLSPHLQLESAGVLGDWAASGLPMTVVMPEFHDKLPPAEARRRLAGVTAADVVVLDWAHGGDWLEETDRVLDQVVRTIAPDAVRAPEGGTAGEPGPRASFPVPRPRRTDERADKPTSERPDGG